MKTKDVFSEEFLTEQLLYNCVMYLPLEDIEITENYTLQEIIEKAENDNTKLSDAEKEEMKLYIPVIKSILEKDETLGQCEINDFSWLDKDGDGEKDHPLKGMQACTFTNPTTKDTFVTFRGTPSGAWLDNGKMMIGLTEFCEDYTDNDGNTFKYMSSMQVQAVEYIDKLLGKYGDSWFEGGKKNLIGHSKGGNEAILVMMLYEEYFDTSMGMDAPGYSNELLAEIKTILGEDKYNHAQAKMYGLNAVNDFVHCLGVSAILASNIRWFQPFKEDPLILPNHYCTAFYEKGKRAPFASGPGPVARFVGRASQEAMELPDELRASVFITLMGLFQMVQGKDMPINAGEEDWTRIIRGVNEGTVGAVEVIMNVLTKTQEGRDFCQYLYDVGTVKLLLNLLDNVKVNIVVLLSIFGPIITSIIKGITITGIADINRIYRDDKIKQHRQKSAGIHYVNTSDTCAIIEDSDMEYLQKIYEEIDEASLSLGRMKYWKVNDRSLRKCLRNINIQSIKLLDYQRLLKKYANKAKKAEEDFIDELEKNGGKGK